ncbi:hypothetical protein H7142_03550 [Candidatus Saccharibacteria bacterium]|nr:hypothetical protein [Candidatus Saccharibacteria bacterium]
MTVGNQWYKLFKQYEAINGNLPSQIAAAPANTRLCLGTGFPIGNGGVARCQDVIIPSSLSSPAEADSDGLMAELRTVSELPSSKPIPSRVTGPYIFKPTLTDYYVVIGVDGSYSIGADCGGGYISGFVDTANNGSACSKRL